MTSITSSPLHIQACTHSVPALSKSSSCICIAVHLKPRSPIRDQEQDPDRWVSHAASGQEAWQLISQWVWKLRLELGHQLQPESVRTVSRLLLLFPRSQHPPLLPPVLFLLRWGPPGKLAASGGRILPSSRTGRCAVQQSKP
jgi:hypothetical protein